MSYNDHMNTLKTYRIGKRPLPFSVVRRARTQHERVAVEDFAQQGDFETADLFDDIRLERMQDCASGRLVHARCQPDSDSCAMTCAFLLDHPGYR